MKTNEYFKETGTANKIENCMIGSVTYNKANADLLFSIIHKNKMLLSNDECFVEDISDSFEDKNKSSDDTAMLGLMLAHQKYHINIKYTTLALICLIFDIAVSQGFASFLLPILGVDYSLVKLDDMEKCIAYKLKEEKALSSDELKHSCQCNFVHYNLKCGKLNDDGTCNNWVDSEMIDETLESMINKKVIKLKGDKYVLVF